eukprot:3935834-Rhodomonas_salina.1
MAVHARRRIAAIQRDPVVRANCQHNAAAVHYFGVNPRRRLGTNVSIWQAVAAPGKHRGPAAAASEHHAGPAEGQGSRFAQVDSDTCRLHETGDRQTHRH